LNARELELISDSAKDIVIREPAENPMENFSSFPPEEEQEFEVYEERMQSAARSANRIGVGVAVILTVVVLAIIFGFWDPDLLRKEHEQFDQVNAGPAPAATPPSPPAAAPATAPPSTTAPAPTGAAPAAAPAATPPAAGQPAQAPAAAAAPPTAAPPAAAPHK
jgi:hypothetical protein